MSTASSLPERSWPLLGPIFQLYILKGTRHGKFSIQSVINLYIVIKVAIFSRQSSSSRCSLGSLRFRFESELVSVIAWPQV